MSFAEALWSFGLLALLLLVLFSVMRVRRRTNDFQHMREFKQRLPSSTAAIEKLTLYASALLVGGLIFRIFAMFHSGPVTGATAVYAVVGTFLIAIPAGALGANGASWIVPQLRRANHAAMSGSEISFASANRGLLLFALGSIPFGLIALGIAAIKPWVR